jgi:hypothetical protein
MAMAKVQSLLNPFRGAGVLITAASADLPHRDGFRTLLSMLSVNPLWIPLSVRCRT